MVPDQPPIRHFLRPSGSIDPLSLLADLDGFGIEESDVRLELARDGISYENATVLQQEQAIQTVATRLLLAAQGARLGLHKNETFLAEIRRTYLDQLSARFLQAKMAKEVTITSGEVRSFIRDNAALFEGRTYYTFDTLSIPTAAVDRLDKTLIESSLSLDDVADMLRENDIAYRRSPFSSYSEELPKELLDYMPELERTGRPFYLKNGELTNIAIILSSQATPIAESQRFELARERLMAIRRSVALSEYEAEILAKSKPNLNPDRFRTDDPVDDDTEADAPKEVPEKRN